MFNDHSGGYLQNCCCSNQLSVARLHASHPPAQTCGGEDIVYIFFSNISWTPSSGPHYKSLFGLPHPLAEPCYNFMGSFFAKHQITQVTQPHFSPDLAPCDFWLFPKLKLPLKRKRFQTTDEIQKNKTEQLMAIGRTV